jgi:hypothetical protein
VTTKQFDASRNNDGATPPKLKQKDIVEVFGWFVGRYLLALLLAVTVVWCSWAAAWAVHGLLATWPHR